MAVRDVTAAAPGLSLALQHLLLQVLKEATILSARRALDPSFKLFVVRFPETTDELLDTQGYGPLFLSMIQHVGGVDPDSIATTVRQQLGYPVLSDTSFDASLGRLSDVLQRVGDNALARVARTLNSSCSR
jgi:hypothetical protein